ncbi:MAG: methyltransferase type 11 [Gammaproteobacteria bacterium]|nr:MAG: methyltransferase type 11 [Gammaproteobacteria bacterium]
MDSKFFGCTSSELAKSRYVPIKDKQAIEHILLGANTSAVLKSDPKLLGFTASKHKFVGKMLAGKAGVLEIGCMDGFGSAIVSSFVGHLTAIDFYKSHIDDAVNNVSPHFQNIEFRGHDILDGPVSEGFDGAFSLDVLEHIDPEQEDLYMKNVVDSLNDSGVFVVGMPSLESQAYASEVNRFSHINCKTAKAMFDFSSRYFVNVFAFGMNDETLHTGFGPMCQYIINVCSVPKRGKW